MHTLLVLVTREGTKFPVTHNSSSTDAGLPEIQVPYIHNVYHSATVFGVSMIPVFYMCHSC